MGGEAGVASPEDLGRELVEGQGGVRQAGADEGARASYVAEVKRALEGNLYAFARVVLRCTRLTADRHAEVCAYLQSVPPRRKALLMPRGTFKTTLAKCLALHILIQQRETNIYFPDGVRGEGAIAGRDIRILFASETQAKATEQLSWIKHHCEANGLLRALWPEVFWRDPRRESPRWTAEAITLRRDGVYPEPSILSIGVGGKITGRHFMVHILDDITGRAALESRAVLEQAVRWFSLLEPIYDDPEHALEVITATRWVEGDIAHLVMQGRRWSSEEDGGRAVYRIGAEGPDGEPLFPTIYPKKLLEKLKLPPPDGLGRMYHLLIQNEHLDPQLIDFPAGQTRLWRRVSEGVIGIEEDPRDVRIEAEPDRLPVRARNIPVGVPFDRSLWEVLHSS